MDDSVIAPPCPSDISPAQRGKPFRPSAPGHFPRAAGETRATPPPPGIPLRSCVGLLGSRVPFRWAKGEGGSTDRRIWYKVCSTFGWGHV